MGRRPQSAEDLALPSNSEPTPPAAPRSLDHEREYWVQQYFLANHRKLGFPPVKGPFEVGPDFLTTIRGQEVGIEIERDFRGWFQHRHDKNPAFRRVGFLVVLQELKPTPAQQKRLPKSVVIDQHAYQKWVAPRKVEYAIRKGNEDILEAALSSLSIAYARDTDLGSDAVGWNAEGGADTSLGPHYPLSDEETDALREKAVGLLSERFHGRFPLNRTTGPSDREEMLAFARSLVNTSFETRGRQGLFCHIISYNYPGFNGNEYWELGLVKTEDIEEAKAFEAQTRERDRCARTELYFRLNGKRIAEAEAVRVLRRRER